MAGVGAVRLREDRVLVLPEHRILFVPVPKSGCTSVKWHLAALAGLPADQFASSREQDITRSLGIHDMALWDERFHWSSLTADQQEAILGDDTWLRFAVVRDPAPRLWSAWLSKLLLAEPRFVRRFGGESWFPTDLSSVDGVLKQFRAFVKLLMASDAPHDSHWAAQHPMVGGFNLNFIGRAERPDLTWARLDEHAPSSAVPRDPPRENRSFLPYAPGVYDGASAAALNTTFREDLAEFGYRRLDVRDATDEAWRERAAAALPVLEELRARHERIGELLALLREADDQVARLERRLERSVAREKEALRELRTIEARQS